MSDRAPSVWVSVEDRLASSLDLIRQAKELATKGHADDLREDGKPYIGHVRNVASTVRTAEAVIVAWLHDLGEMHPDYMPLIKASFPEWVFNAVDGVTRRPGESHVDYVLRVLKDERSIDVKICDVRDNLKDQKNGNRRDKYELTLRLLESARNGQVDKVVSLLIPVEFQ